MKIPTKPVQEIRKVMSSTKDFTFDFTVRSADLVIDIKKDDGGLGFSIKTPTDSVNFFLSEAQTEILKIWLNEGMCSLLE